MNDLLIVNLVQTLLSKKRDFHIHMNNHANTAGQKVKENLQVRPLTEEQYRLVFNQTLHVTKKERKINLMQNDDFMFFL